MECWSAEIKSGRLFHVKLGKGKVLFLSQACLGESKKKTNESVCLNITHDNKKFVIGTLHPKRLSVQVYDLFFDKDVYISHDWKDGSVYFYGYKAEQPPDEPYCIEDSDSECIEMEDVRRHQLIEDYVKGNEDDDDDEEEEASKQQSGKKRAKESASKTHSTDKKAKITTTPWKTGEVLGQDK